MGKIICKSANSDYLIINEGVQTYEYHCSKCEKGIIRVINISRKKYNEMRVEKCDSCKHQFYVNQVSKLKIITFVFPFKK